jgi:hypothetical protein
MSIRKGKLAKLIIGISTYSGISGGSLNVLSKVEIKQK